MWCTWFMPHVLAWQHASSVQWLNGPPVSLGLNRWRFHPLPSHWNVAHPAPGTGPGPNSQCFQLASWRWTRIVATSACAAMGRPPAHFTMCKCFAYSQLGLPLLDLWIPGELGYRITLEARPWAAVVDCIPISLGSCCLMEVKRFGELCSCVVQIAH